MQLLGLAILINFKAKTRVRSKWTKETFITCHSNVISLIKSGNMVHITNYKWFATSDIIRQVFWKFIDTSIQNLQSILAGFLNILFCLQLKINAQGRFYIPVYMYMYYQYINSFFFFWFCQWRRWTKLANVIYIKCKAINLRKKAIFYYIHFFKNNLY